MKVIKSIFTVRTLCLLAMGLFFITCKRDKGSSGDGMDLTDLPYGPVSYAVDNPPNYPQLEFPADNPLTIDGVQLGRHLFYDPILSRDSTMACAGCHEPAGGFTDNLAVSTGVDGIAGTRSSMSLVDVGYHLNGLFWDGSASSLEDQALLPVEDEIELHHMWPEVIAALRGHADYPQRFRAAFGIENTSEITRELAVMAIAQFERSLVSSGRSYYDRSTINQWTLEDDEFIGLQIFFDTNPDLPDGQCFHCHAAPLFTDNVYHNNGLDIAPDFEDFVDLGRGAHTGERTHNGTFRTPTLRNIEFTAPYMHDGRFNTLEEVMDHYISGGHPSINKSPFLDSINLNTEQKLAVIAFLKTLSDTTMLNDERYGPPE